MRPRPAPQACPNEAFRQGPSAKLLDCRAYEMVNPADMEGVEVKALNASEGPAPTAAPDGNTVAWSAYGAFGEAASSPANSLYLSKRGANDWSSQNIGPPLDPYAFLVAVNFPGFDENVDELVIEAGLEPPITPDAEPETTNLYVRDNANGSFRLLSQGFPATHTAIYHLHYQGNFG